MRDRENIVIIAWAVWWGLMAFLVAAALVYVTVKPARSSDAVLMLSPSPEPLLGQKKAKKASRKAREAA